MAVSALKDELELNVLVEDVCSYSKSIGCGGLGLVNVSNSCCSWICSIVIVLAGNAVGGHGCPMNMSRVAVSALALKDGSDGCDARALGLVVVLPCCRTAGWWTENDLHTT